MHPEDRRPGDDVDADRDADRGGRVRVPGWVFVVVPLLLVGGLVAAIAVAARPDSDRGGVERIDGPAAELAAVAAALEALPSTDGEPADDADPAGSIGRRVGALGTGLVEVEDRNDFTEQFGLLPDAAADQLGESLGAIQRELSPASIGGPRGADDRRADTVFALGLAWPAAQVLDPSATPEEQALNVLPAAVPLADSGEAIVAAVVVNDMDTAAELLDGVLSEAGAAEIVSGVAGDLSDRLGNLNEPERLDAFQDAYRLELP